MVDVTDDAFMKFDQVAATHVRSGRHVRHVHMHRFPRTQNLFTWTWKGRPCVGVTHATARPMWSTATSNNLSDVSYQVRLPRSARLARGVLPRFAAAPTLLLRRSAPVGHTAHRRYPPQPQVPVTKPTIAAILVAVGQRPDPPRRPAGRRSRALAPEQALETAGCRTRVSQGDGRTDCPSPENDSTNEGGGETRCHADASPQISPP